MTFTKKAQSSYQGGKVKLTKREEIFEFNSWVHAPQGDPRSIKGALDRAVENPQTRETPIYTG